MAAISQDSGLEYGRLFTQGVLQNGSVKIPGGVRNKNKPVYEIPLLKEFIMARSKPYTGGLMILDITLTLLTGGFWLIVVLFREMWRRK